MTVAAAKCCVYVFDLFLFTIPANFFETENRVYFTYLPITYFRAYLFNAFIFRCVFIHIFRSLLLYSFLFISFVPLNSNRPFHISKGKQCHPQTTSMCPHFFVHCPDVPEHRHSHNNDCLARKKVAARWRVEFQQR